MDADKQESVVDNLRACHLRMGVCTSNGIDLYNRCKATEQGMDIFPGFRDEPSVSVRSERGAGHSAFA